MLAGAGTLCGLTWNAFSGHGFALTAHVYVRPGEELVDAPQAHAMWRRGALFIDAREPEIYALGHVPGALVLPSATFDTGFARLEPSLRGRLEVVVYCAGFGCEASHLVARRLKERGVPAAVLHEGWPAWTAGRYPVARGAQP